MNSLQNLIEAFRQFPGIGPRQAKRFAYFLLTQKAEYLRELTSLIDSIKKDVTICSDCYRFFSKDKAGQKLCAICQSPNRDDHTLMIVARDIDVEALEKSRLFNGRYFVLGGGLPILDPKPEEKIRLRELKDTVENKLTKGLTEIILGLNLNPEGENTADYLTQFLAGTAKEHNLKISHLGRGLSTGTELEYSDSETLKSALSNRH